MSLCHIPEGVQLKYFSGRINEKEKKSLLISTIYSIKSHNLTVNRTIFSSGSPKIEASITKDAGNSKDLEAQTNTAESETDYDNYLRHTIAISSQNLPYIPDLIFGR